MSLQLRMLGLFVLAGGAVITAYGRSDRLQSLNSRDGRGDAWMAGYMPLVGIAGIIIGVSLLYLGYKTIKRPPKK